MKPLLTFSEFLFESTKPTGTSVSCDYYSTKPPVPGKENFWANFEKMDGPARVEALKKIEAEITNSIRRVQKDLTNWYQDPQTRKKLNGTIEPISDEDLRAGKYPKEKVRRYIVNEILPNLKYLMVTKRQTDTPVPGAWGWYSSERPTTIVINLFNFWDGTNDGNKNLYDTLKHEATHLIDDAFGRFGLEPYNPTHSRDETPEEYDSRYVVGDKDSFARLNVFRGAIGARPLDDGAELLKKFMAEVAAGRITSKRVRFEQGTDSKGRPVLIMRPVTFTLNNTDIVGKEGGRNDAGPADRVLNLITKPGSLVVQGQENPNIKQLFSAYSSIGNGVITVRMYDLGQYNKTTAAIGNDNSTAAMSA
jgi:hypothetical protein